MLCCTFWLSPREQALECRCGQTAKTLISITGAFPATCLVPSPPNLSHPHHSVIYKLSHTQTPLKSRKHIHILKGRVVRSCQVSMCSSLGLLSLLLQVIWKHLESHIRVSLEYNVFLMSPQQQLPSLQEKKNLSPFLLKCKSQHAAYSTILCFMTVCNKYCTDWGRTWTPQTQGTLTRSARVSFITTSDALQQRNYLIPRQLTHICDDFAIIRKSEIMSVYLQAWCRHRRENATVPESGRTLGEAMHVLIQVNPQMPLTFPLWMECHQHEILSLFLKPATQNGERGKRYPSWGECRTRQRWACHHHHHKELKRN